MAYKTALPMFFLGCLLVCATTSQAQVGKKVHVPRAVGICYGSNLTPEQAKQKAVQFAKEEALRKAGVSEQIMSSDFSYLQAKKDSIHQLFSSFSTVELQGELAGFKIDSLYPFLVQDQIAYKAIIQADIILFAEKSDPKFRFQVNGIDAVYRNQEKLKFNFTGTAAGYLHIFLFSGNQAYQLFPSSDEQAELFGAGKTATFPRNPNLDYLLETNQQIEEDNLLFVYTKEDFRFTGDAQTESIWKWISTIPLSKRRVEVVQFLIKR